MENERSVKGADVGAGKKGPQSGFALSYFALLAIYGVSTPYLQLLIRGLGYRPAAVGLFLGLFEVVGILGPLALARLADSWGRYKPLLFACALLTIAPLAPLILLRSPAATILFLSILAFGLRSMSPLLDAATVAMSSARKGSEYGRIRAVGSAGFVAVALVLQVIPGFDSSPPARIALSMAVLALFFGLSLLGLPESGSRGSPAALKKAPRTGPAFSGLFVLGLIIIALGRLSMSPINAFFSLYLIDEVKWNAVGGMWALAALSEIPLMMLSGRIVGRLGPMRSIALGTVAIVLRLAIYALFPKPLGIVVAQLLHSLCFGLCYPAGVAFVALMVPPERRAQGMAAYIGLALGLPSFAGSALGGFIVQLWGYRVLFGSFTVFALASLGLFAVTKRKWKRDS